MTRLRTRDSMVKTKPMEGEEWEEWMDWGGEAETRGEQHNSEEETTNPPWPLPSRHSSEVSPTSPQASRKRKLSSEDEDIKDAPDANTSVKKPIVQDRSHSVVEKRYRENLNQKISDLRECIPNLRPKSSAVRPGETAAQKQNKATVLTEAMAYIRHLEQRNSHLEEANHCMKEQMRFGGSPRTLEEAPKDSTVQGEVDHDSDGAEPEQAHADEPVPPKGLIPVPEEMRRLWQGQSREHYADRISHNAGDSGSGSISIRGGKYLGRMVFGSLAGVMILDGIATPSKRMEKREERGLSAMPLPHILTASRRLVTFGMGVLPTSHLLIPTFWRFLLVFCVFGLLLFLYLYYSKPPPSKSASQHPEENQLSLASPLEIHQNAWLTSIQTVWVPRRHMISEILALVLETSSYLTRLMFGWRCYSWLTGRTEEEELARVRAWEIALDAQLSGGDPEISKSRLVLTLWAAGTLPSTPACLMLKALHIRILFWKPSRFETVCQVMHSIARSLAAYQWKKATVLQQVMDGNHENVGILGAEPLPDHLKALLREPPDDVLNDIAIQRASNLAWNMPDDGTSKSAEKNADHMADDSAMLGPLDKLSLWYVRAGPPGEAR